MRLSIVFLTALVHIIYFRDTKTWSYDRLKLTELNGDKHKA